MNMTDCFLDNQYGLCRPDTPAELYIDGTLLYEQWQKRLRKVVYALLGRFPAPGRKVSYYDQGNEEKIPGGTRRKIAYYTEEYLDTPCWLLTPSHTDKSTPVILCLHGHGIGCGDIVGIRKETSYEKDFALTVCQSGMIAIAPEMAGFGELRLSEDIATGPEDGSSCHRLSMDLLACGRTMAGVRVHQCMRALDLAGSLFPSNPTGVMGISGGGMVASLLAALDDRITACVISGYANSFRDSILAMHHCVDNYFPGMLTKIEMQDLLSAVAPRPMLWETGSNDPIFPQSATLSAGKTVQKCYEKLGAVSNFHICAFEGGHEVNGTEAFSFLKEQCKVL